MNTPTLQKTIPNDVYAAKMGAAPELDNLLKTATNVSYKADDGRHPDAVRGWKYYDVLFAVKNSNAEKGYSVFDGKLNVKQIAMGDLFHDITDIKEVTSKTAGQNILSGISADSAGDSSSIFHIAENVNTEFELAQRREPFQPAQGAAYQPRRPVSLDRTVSTRAGSCRMRLPSLSITGRSASSLLRYKENADIRSLDAKLHAACARARSSADQSYIGYTLHAACARGWVIRRPVIYRIYAARRLRPGLGFSVLPTSLPGAMHRRRNPSAMLLPLYFLVPAVQYALIPCRCKGTMPPWSLP